MTVTWARPSSTPGLVKGVSGRPGAINIEQRVSELSTEIKAEIKEKAGVMKKEINECKPELKEDEINPEEDKINPMEFNP